MEARLGEYGIWQIVQPLFQTWASLDKRKLPKIGYSYSEGIRVRMRVRIESRGERMYIPNKYGGRAGRNTAGSKGAEHGNKCVILAGC